MEPCKPDLLPIKEINWEPLIPLIGKANRDLSYYNGVLVGISNPDVLLSPMTTQEAVLSSKIEGTQATLGEVLKFEAGESPEKESRRQDIEEIINYRVAMFRAEDELQTRPFSLNLLKRLHLDLLAGVRGRDKGRGEFRTVQNWIAVPRSPIEKAQFVPPAPDSVPKYMDNWEKYWHLTRPDPLVQLAIIHAQFEIVHPFLDGNGRLGRMMVPLFLYEKQLLSKPEFYISAYLEVHRDAYVENLRSLCLKPETWNRWIEFFLTALSEQAISNAEKGRQIIQLYNRLKSQVLELTHSQFAVPMLDEIFKRPVFSSNIFTKLAFSPSRPAINTLLNRLIKGNILQILSKGSGRRPQIIALTELINLCEGKPVL